MSGLAAVGESALPGGFRTTVLTRPVGVIDVAVRVVAGGRATEMSVVRWECVERPVIGCVFDGGHMLAERVSVDVMRARAGHQVVGHVDLSGDINIVGELFGLCARFCGFFPMVLTVGISLGHVDLYVVAQLIGVARWLGHVLHRYSVFCVVSFYQYRTSI